MSHQSSKSNLNVLFKSASLLDTEIQQQLLSINDFNLLLNSNKSDTNNYNNLYELIPFNNDVLINEYYNSNKNIDIACITKDNDDDITTNDYTNIPLFHIGKKCIKIPNKVEYNLKRFIPKQILRDIHPNLDVAIELCLLFTTQLTSTYFGIIDGSQPEGWKSLKAEYLRDFLSLHPKTYKRVIQALEYPLINGAILECDYSYEIGKKCHHYRFGEAYKSKGFVTYTLRTTEAQGLLNKYFARSYSSAIKNPICRNLIQFYSHIQLPSILEIESEAKRLIKLGYKTKKGKRLTFLNKHSKTYFKNYGQLSFVEEAIKIFEYLTTNGLMIPECGSDASGGRVVDSFTLMPSWIRRLVKIDGEQHIEADYTCLHPNIAMSLYGGKNEYLTHAEVASNTGIDLDVVKVEHLSFFNKKVWQMKDSPLFDYYAKAEPKMLDNIILEKYSSDFKHKITSRKMFQSEVQIMMDVVTQLNKEDIYVGYVYDALFCHPKHANHVKELMDSILLKHGIKTQSKLSVDVKNNIIKVKNSDKKLSSYKQDSQPETHTVVTPVINNQLKLKFNQINRNTNIKEDVLNLVSSGEKLTFIDAIVDFQDGTYLDEKVVKVNDIYCPEKKYMPYRFLYQ